MAQLKLTFSFTYVCLSNSQNSVLSLCHGLLGSGQVKNASYSNHCSANALYKDLELKIKKDFGKFLKIKKQTCKFGLPYLTYNESEKND